MTWIYRNTPDGFDDLSLAEMNAAGLKQESKRFFTGDNFDLSQSAYASFTVQEISRGSTPEEAIKNITISIPSPYRVEKIDGKRRQGSMSFALLAEKHLTGNIRASNPASIILVFTPDNKVWVTGFVTEKKDSVIEQLDYVTQRTCVSLTTRAALALVNIVKVEPIVDPCCGTGLIPLASLLRKKKTYFADNNFKMLNMTKINSEKIGLDIEVNERDAFDPWIKDCCLVTDFPADRSWNSNTQDLSLKLFHAWIPFIKSFCVIIPNRVLSKLSDKIIITKKITFTGDRSIIMGTIIN